MEIQNEPQQQFDFSIPQRLSNSGFWVESLLGLGKTIKNLIVVFLYLIIKQASIFLTWQFWLIFFLFTLLYFIFSYLTHRQFSFWIDEKRGEFIVKKGLLNKSTIVLKFDNIQQVNVKQNMIQQALDLYAIEIESAGSAEKEVNLYALEEEKALALKDYLTQKRLGNIEAPVIESTSELVFKIKNRKILLISLFTNYEKAFGLFLVFLFGLWETFRELTPLTKNLINWDQNIESIFEFSLLIVFSFIGIFFLIPLVINVFKYLIRYYGFQLSKQKNGNMSMQFGLVEIQNILLNREKIQILSYVDNWILRKWDLAVLSLHQISIQNDKPEKSLIHIPGIQSDQSEQLLKSIFENRLPNLKKADNFETIRPKVGLLLFRFTWITLFGLVIFFITYWKDLGLFSWTLATAMLGALYAANYQYFLNYKLLRSDGFLIKISGIWDITRIILPVHKIQSVKIEQNFIQKRTGTAHITFSTASGDIRFSYLPISFAITLSNRILVEVELRP